MESWYVTTFLNRCPHCGEGKLFSGFIQLRETCEVCGARYERWSGLWTGPVVIGYGVGAVVAVVLILVLHGMDLLVPGAEWGVALASCAAVLATYRPAKGAYVALMYEAGYIYPDPPEAPAPADAPAAGPSAAAEDPSRETPPEGPPGV